jgi:ribosome-binding factor A
MKRTTAQREAAFARLAATFINECSNRQSLITVTGATLSSDGARVTILVTVLPEDKEHTVFDFLKRHRSAFKEYIRHNTRIGRIPSFDFDIDHGEKNRQRIEELSKK